MWLIGFRIVQGVGGAFISANSGAILTDAFPANQRGMALGINNVASIAGRFLGLVVGGLLATIDWRLVFFVSVPFGIFGTVWAYFRARGARASASRRRSTGWGNVTFGVGLILVMIAITYGIQPYGGHVMGWTSPRVLDRARRWASSCCASSWSWRRGCRTRCSAWSCSGSGPSPSGRCRASCPPWPAAGLMFMLIIWLQGIWLPLHGYSLLLDTAVGRDLHAAAVDRGRDRRSASPATSPTASGHGRSPPAGCSCTALAFVLLQLLPTDFSYPAFAAIILLSGLGTGAFASPNRAGVMNSLPPEHRGAGSGMNTTFQNSAQVLSIGVFFTLMIIGLSVGAAADPRRRAARPRRVRPAVVAHVAHLPPVSVLFAAFLGYNPLQHLLGSSALASLPPSAAAQLTSRVLLPVADLGPVPVRAARGLHLRPDLLPRRRRRLVVAGQAVRARAHQRRHTRPAGGRC